MGHGIHEMGTARMGTDAKTSVLNKWNPVMGYNVFVTDGLFYGFIRLPESIFNLYGLYCTAADYAVEQLKNKIYNTVKNKTMERREL